jgi:hypothetical protein
MTINAQTPILKYLSVSGTVGTVTFAQGMGAAYILNSGAVMVFIAFDSNIPLAALGDGTFGIPPGTAVNLDDIFYEKINAITAGSQADLQVIGLVRGA